MEDIIHRGLIGSLGTFLSFSLQSIDTIASIAVAVATLLYMILSTVTLTDCANGYHPLQVEVINGNSTASDVVALF